MGSVFVACNKSSMLTDRQSKNPPNQSLEVSPTVSFALPKQVAKPTSNSPATIRIIQFICLILSILKLAKLVNVA